MLVFLSTKRDNHFFLFRDFEAVSKDTSRARK